MKISRYIATAGLMVFMAGCFGPAPKPADSTTERANTVHDELADLSDEDAEVWDGNYRKLAPGSIIDNFIKIIGKDWMLITAGDEQSYNTMIASWGAMGEMWSVPAAFITVRNTRYTHEFLDKNEYFTLSFFHEDFRQALKLLGSKSGRDGDKVAESGLTPVPTSKGSMAFSEARMVIECRKMYAGALRPQDITDEGIRKEYYDSTPGETHTLFIGEIVAVWVRTNRGQSE